MKQRVFLFIVLFASYLLLFACFRGLFLLGNINFTGLLSVNQLVGVFFNGLLMDVSAVGYLMLAPTFLLGLSVLIKKELFANALSAYHGVILLFISILVIVDLVLYSYWGFRIDSTPLLYLKSPKEALASVSGVQQIVFLIIILVVFLASFYFLRRIINPIIDHFKPARWYIAFIFVLLAGSLIIPIRGGVGIAPMNPGKVYFSQTPFANHAALNVLWNFGYSLTMLDEEKNPYHFYQKNQYLPVIDSMYSACTNQVQVVKSKPNVVIIILEGFTAKAIQSLGGYKNAAPCLDSIARNGLLFSQCYASGDRSDKGLVSILSGFPALPNSSVIKYTKKTEKLPHLPQLFNEKGYHTTFYYGGDIDFANMRSYLTTSGFKRFVSQKDFPADNYNSKWGVHDHVMLDFFAREIESASTPFFSVLFTLSSHEPYDVPHHSIFTGNDREARFLNSMHYTDSCLGVFFNRIKKSSKWENTLFILVSDHGNGHPGATPYDQPDKFHIPMIWTGGALLKNDTIVSGLISQTDLATTLLHQLGWDASAFKFGKNTLCKQFTPFASYYYNNGMGYMDTTGFFIFDLNARRPVLVSGDTAQLKRRSTMFLQQLYDEFERY